jgi:hypothetical protein
MQVQIAAATRVNQATIARFEEGTAWPRRPEKVLLAYAGELGMDVRVLWLHGFVLWIENEPVLDDQAGRRSGRRCGGWRRRGTRGRSGARWVDRIADAGIRVQVETHSRVVEGAARAPRAAASRRHQFLALTTRALDRAACVHARLSHRPPARRCAPISVLFRNRASTWLG